MLQKMYKNYFIAAAVLQMLKLQNHVNIKYYCSMT